MNHDAVRLAIAALFVMMQSQLSFGQGAILSAAGPVHRSMGGASTAAPISAISAIYWNPASISGMANGELEVGLDLLSIEHEVQSTFGPFSGQTEGDAGTFPIPNFGWVHRNGDSPITIGLGVNSIAGFKTTLPIDPTNPVLSPQPLGLGAVSSEASFLQISPVVSYAINEQFCIAAGPNLALGQLGVEPFVFTSANSDGSYPSGRASHYQFGCGVQTGVYYIGDRGWNLGASIKSPTWMDQFEFAGQDQNGMPRNFTAHVDLPMILSIGTAYTGLENWVFALDGRFIDYANADGLGDAAQFRPDGSLPGLGWRSVFATAFGIQRRFSDRFTIRTGYSYNQSPIQSSNNSVNIPAPLLYEHIYSVGGSYSVCQHVSLNVAYSHYFEAEEQGSIVSPVFGAIPGTSVTNRVSADLLSFGISMRH
ncbi:OmpP1/FadL family transporter [Pirellulaceae bacterium SH467]